MNPESYIRKLSYPGFWGGKLVLDLFEALNPEIKVLIFKSNEWFNASGALIVLNNYLQYFPGCLLIKECEQSRFHFDVCDEKGKVLKKIRNDGDSLFNAICISIEIRGVKPWVKLYSKDSVALRSAIASFLKKNAESYRSEILQQIEEIHKDFQVQQKTESLPFKLADDDVLINLAKMIALLTNDLNLDIESMQVALDFKDFLDKLEAGEEEIKFSSLKKIVENSSQELRNLIQNSKPYIFYRSVNDLRTISKDQSEWIKLTKKSVALFLGKTRAGKSSTINRLLNIPGELKNQGTPFAPKWVIDFKQNGGARVDNDNNVSCTATPEILQSTSDENLFYCDTVGFGDSRDGSYGIKNAVTLRNILKNAIGTCIILVLDINEFKEKIDFTIYHEMIRSLLGKNYFNFRKNVLVLVGKGDSNGFERFQGDLTNVIKGKLESNWQTREFANFINGICHAWYPCDFYDHIQNNVEEIKNKIKELPTTLAVEPVIIGQELRAANHFFRAFREQIILSFHKFGKTIIEESKTNSELDQTFKQLEDLKTFADELSLQIHKKVSLTVYLKNALSSISKGTELNSRLEKHVNEMIQFLDDLDPLISPEIKEENSDSLLQMQSNSSLVLHELFALYMNALLQILIQLADENYIKFANKLAETEKLSEYFSKKEEVKKIKEERGAKNQDLETRLSSLEKAAGLSNDKTIYDQAKSYLQNSFMNLDRLIGYYEGDTFGSVQRKILHDESVQVQKQFSEQAENSIKKRQQNWIFQQTITVIRSISSPVVRELVERLGETAATNTLIKQAGNSQLLKYVPFAGLAVGVFQGVSNFFSGNYRAGFLNFVSGTVSLVPVYGTYSALAIDLTSAALDLRDQKNAESVQKKTLITLETLEAIVRSLEERHKEHELEELRKSIDKSAIGKRKRKHILSIDGGGMFGVVAARILVEIELRLKTSSLYQYFDLFAGTSSGSIVASALSLRQGNHEFNKFGAIDVIRIFLNERNLIFSAPKTNWFQSRYSNKGLRQVLNKYIGKTILTVDTLVPLLIVACKKDEPEKYSTFDFSYDERIPEKTRPTYLLRKAVLASASAPTYFPEVELDLGVQGRSKFCDGGLLANNPSARAFDHMLLKHNKNLTAKDIIVVSIGTGDLPADKLGNLSSDGKADWAANGVRRQINQAVTDTDNRLKEIFKEIPNQYFRFQPKFSLRIEMDDISEETMIELLRGTGDYLKQKEISDLIDILVKKLQEN